MHLVAHDMEQKRRKIIKKTLNGGVRIIFFVFLHRQFKRYKQLVSIYSIAFNTDNQKNYQIIKET